MNLTTTKKRLNGWINLLTADHIARGRVWYSNAHTFAQELADTYNIPLDRVVGVLACLSVNNRWDVNKRNAEDLCRAFSEGLPLEDVSVTTYPEQKAKALAILRLEAETDIPAIIGKRTAAKTKAFYDNILYPKTSFRVTIDRWITRGLGLEGTISVRGNSWPKTCNAIEELFRQAALVTDLRPCELQAAMWCCIQETAAAEKWEGSRPGTGLPPAEEEVPF